MNFNENFSSIFSCLLFLKFTFENHWPKCLPNFVNVTWLYTNVSNTWCGGEGTKQNYLSRSKQKFFSLFSFYPLSPSTWLRFFFLMSFLMVVGSKSTWNRRLFQKEWSMLELNMIYKNDAPVNSSRDCWYSAFK